MHARDIPVESWYEWKEYEILEGEDSPRLLTPRDSADYEFPINFMFDSVEQACMFLNEWDEDREESKDWVLVKVTMEPLDLTTELLKGVM